MNDNNVIEVNRPFEAFTPSDTETQAVIERLITGKPLDPEVYNRIRERSERATAEILKTQGVLDIAVDLIRETRDGQ